MASWLGSPAFVAACTTSLCPKAPRLVLQNVICLRTFVPFQPAATASRCSPRSAYQPTGSCNWHAATGVSGLSSPAVPRPCLQQQQRQYSSLACTALGSRLQDSLRKLQVDYNDDGEDDQTSQPTETSEPASIRSAPSQRKEVLAISELPPGKHIRVKTAEYISSSVDVSKCPPPKHPEFAVIGRSNVGKSSLINLLAGRRSLALVSKTPGKTVCINFFLINEKEAPWYMVDLPGYGYAKRSKTSRFEWNKFTKKYFLERETLANVLLLLDSTIPPQEVDLSCADWLAEAQIPFSLVFTKVDKRKKKCPPPEENIQAFIDDLRQRWDAVPPVFATSGVSGVGKQELLTYLAQLRQLFVEQHAEL